MFCVISTDEKGASLCSSFCTEPLDTCTCTCTLPVSISIEVYTFSFNAEKVDLRIIGTHTNS